jgi:Holliday junction resolvase-like predicted endonuclease
MTPEPVPPPDSLWCRVRRRVLEDVWLRKMVLWLRARTWLAFRKQLAGLPMTSKEVGDMGELLASRWLSAHGRRVLYRNYRGANRGEVDIVARHGQVLTFVEVKARTSRDFGRPADAVGRDKQRLIQRGAMDWLRLLGHPRVSFRFDIVEVVLTEGERPHVNVIEDAFQMPESSMAGR